MKISVKLITYNKVTKNGFPVVLQLAHKTKRKKKVLVYSDVTFWNFDTQLPLKSHPDYALAKKQMNNFGGMLSFELKENINAMDFMNNLSLIKPSMSLAGVESTMLSPTQTSHALLSPEERENQGIKDGLIRFSVGIEETKDLIADIEQAINSLS